MSIVAGSSVCIVIEKDLIIEAKPTGFPSNPMKIANSGRDILQALIIKTGHLEILIFEISLSPCTGDPIMKISLGEIQVYGDFNVMNNSLLQ